MVNSLIWYGDIFCSCIYKYKAMTEPHDLPNICPECGAIDAYEKRFTIGGGWRFVYRCSNCGRRYVPTTTDLGR